VRIFYCFILIILLKDVIVLKNIQIQLGEAAGLIVAAEFKMRLIGELSTRVQGELKGKIFLDCNLELLEEAIIVVFPDEFDFRELQQFKVFRKIRNKFVHADFVELMEIMGIEPTGREVFRDGKRNILERVNLKEVILSIERNNVLSKLRTMVNEVIILLDKIILKI
jgi:hypothetical protein